MDVGHPQYFSLQRRRQWGRIIRRGTSQLLHQEFIPELELRWVFGLSCLALGHFYTKVSMACGRYDPSTLSLDGHHISSATQGRAFLVPHVSPSRFRGRPYGRYHVECTGACASGRVSSQVTHDRVALCGSRRSMERCDAMGNLTDIRFVLLLYSTIALVRALGHDDA